ncbi:hypothetical protein GHT06_019624 [Daphnia sinensis]|uniref:Reelin domain-containing protein n=1 Tax=Daphnia sinensis TaxID=1820382 RepID=A0AAD5KKD4_9CRUS|nr:hypothetical protein GHT06_019624 [Daphnia sinensis]
MLRCHAFAGSTASVWTDTNRTKHIQPGKELRREKTLVNKISTIAYVFRFNPSTPPTRIAAFWLLMVAPIHGSPNGAPTAACESMTPGHGYDVQNNSSPFNTEIPAGTIAFMDDPVHLELRASSGTYFKGFLIMAFDKNDNSANPRPIGTFKLIAGSDGQLKNCGTGTMNAVTHTNNVGKNLVRVDWQPPKYYMGTAIFRTTYVQDVSTYWVKTESITVTFVMPDGSTHDPMMTMRADKMRFLLSCHQRIMFTCVVFSVFTLLALPIANASPNGAPTAACESMTPQHGYEPQTSASPFQTEIPVGEYVLMDDPVQLELRASAGTTFKGFLIMAFDKDDNTRPIGTFTAPVDGQLLNCTEGYMNAVTHINPNEKSLVKIEWQPPLYYMGTAVFRTTFVQNNMTYWVKTESIGVSFVMEIPSSASQSSTTWAGLIIASLLALLIQ